MSTTSDVADTGQELDPIPPNLKEIAVNGVLRRRSVSVPEPASRREVLEELSWRDPQGTIVWVRGEHAPGQGWTLDFRLEYKNAEVTEGFCQLRISDGSIVYEQNYEGGMSIVVVDNVAPGDYRLTYSVKPQLREEDASLSCRQSWSKPSLLNPPFSVIVDKSLGQTRLETKIEIRTWYSGNWDRFEPMPESIRRLGIGQRLGLANVLAEAYLRNDGSLVEILDELAELPRKLVKRICMQLNVQLINSDQTDFDAAVQWAQIKSVDEADSFRVSKADLPPASAFDHLTTIEL